MIQIYADGELAYDGRLEEYDLQGLKITTALGKGGTAEIAMHTQHPAYNLYREYRTIVEIYRDGALRFRGRAIYPDDDVNNTRTVICEGELCFLQDGVSRPCQYKDTPANIFRLLVSEYNAQVEPFKQFKLGIVDVPGADVAITLENEDAETVLDTVNKLTELLGGYVIFTTDETGARVINWLGSVGNTSLQTVEAGENLFDFSRSGANTELVTGLVPYGAKDENTGYRLTISAVNGGKDYITDDEAVAIRGTIMKPVFWDEITDPGLLLQAARQYLDEHKYTITSLTLTALDLSYVDKSIESFKLGDLIRVYSRAHGVDDRFQLVEYSEDLLNPAQSFITLGKEIRTLTSLDVAGDSKSHRALQKAVAAVKTDAGVVARQTVQQTEQELREHVSRIYATKEQLTGLVTEEELAGLATKDELTAVWAEIEELWGDSERIWEELGNQSDNIGYLMQLTNELEGIVKGW